MWKENDNYLNRIVTYSNVQLRKVVLSDSIKMRSDCRQKVSAVFLWATPGDSSDYPYKVDSSRTVPGIRPVVRHFNTKHSNTRG